MIAEPKNKAHQEAKIKTLPSSDEDRFEDYWYVAFTKPAKEAIAKENLLKQHYEVAMPLYKSMKLIRQKWQEKIEPMFPRYLFFKAMSHEHSIRPAQYTLGVQKLIKFGDTPARINTDELNKILQLSEMQQHGSFAKISPIKAGDKVSIYSGAFVGLNGIVSTVASERIAVLIEILGKPQILNFAMDELRREA